MEKAIVKSRKSALVPRPPKSDTKTNSTAFAPWADCRGRRGPKTGFGDSSALPSPNGTTTDQRSS